MKKITLQDIGKLKLYCVTNQNFELAAKLRDLEFDIYSEVYKTEIKDEKNFVALDLIPVNFKASRALVSKIKS